MFHAVGTGGRAMERLVESGRIVGVLDLTTTEVVDYLAGGIFPATEDRFEVYTRMRVPLVVSFGAMDMVNFGAKATVPQRYSHRLFHEHNAQITLMRTTAEENAAAAEFMCTRLNRALGPVRVVIPEGGVSKLDAPGAPFWDPAADQRLFETFRSRFQTDANRQCISRPENINSPEFADVVVEQFLEIV